MIHRTALIGEPPEHRDWTPSTDWHFPVVALSARLEAYVTVDAGTYQPTTVGARTWLMKKVHVGHDAVIGADCEIAPMTSVGGEVTIGDGVKVGQGCVFRPRVTVGDGARIGAGAVVVKDVPAGETWVGNPAAEIGATTERRRALGRLLTAEGVLGVVRRELRRMPRGTRVTL